jgi:hypothetical protein
MNDYHNHVTEHEVRAAILVYAVIKSKCLMLMHENYCMCRMVVLENKSLI